MWHRADNRQIRSSAWRIHSCASARHCEERSDGGEHAASARSNGIARTIVACIASLLLYALIFGLLLDRPLTYGYLRRAIDMKLARAAAITEPKLVILAGSGGSYSHSCATLEPLLHRPCVNGGVAVGIGLDYLFARWQRVLRPGDVIYLPMEEAQYVRGRDTTALGPDGPIMLRHDRATLTALSSDRWLGALFATDLREAALLLIETALIAVGFPDPRDSATGETNAWGDHAGHTEDLARASATALATARPFHPSDAQINQGYGTALIARFLDWAHVHEVRVIGGLPPSFADDPLPAANVVAIRALYRAHAAGFIALPNNGQYPRTAFFDTPDHLNETWQVIHSVALAAVLAPLLDAGAVPNDVAMVPGPASSR